MERIALSEEKETLLITFYAKAKESELTPSLLQDHYAAEALERIDYDFARLKVTRDMMVGLAMRAHALDEWTREFIAAHPEAIVLNLGCGLDTRVFRVNPPPSVRWFDVDYPEVAQLRRHLFPDRTGYTLIGASVTDPAWLEDVPRDGRVMVVAEGLLMYLRREDVRNLFVRILARMPSGEAAFDAFNRLGLWTVQRQPSVRATGATLRWSIDDPHELESMAPGLHFVEEVAIYDRDRLDRFSLPARIIVRLMLALPVLRRLGRFLRYRF